MKENRNKKSENLFNYHKKSYFRPRYQFTQLQTNLHPPRKTINNQVLTSILGYITKKYLLWRYLLYNNDRAPGDALGTYSAVQLRPYSRK